MDYVLGIDPGNVESAWALVQVSDCRPIEIGKADNVLVRRMLVRRSDAEQSAWVGCHTTVAIEMIASYGMPVGAEVFDTVLAIGRFAEIVAGPDVPIPPGLLVFRRDVKLHHCQSARANDATITQALVDRFALGLTNKGKGTKARPGWFYGFSRDVWQAYALAVCVADGLRHG